MNGAVKREEGGDAAASPDAKPGGAGGAPQLCPYLDTVNRAALDFDFEKACCVSGNNFNVYACLVCGKYYQGRGRSTPAYLHSLQDDHHVVMNLHTGRIYCLPDGYEVLDNSLTDIRSLLDPTFTQKMVDSLDREISFARGIDGGDYLPGAIGLNNIRGTDYVNAVVQCLVRIGPLRDFFLLPANYAHMGSALVQQFGMLVRKIWSPYNFKGQVSPHELMQAVAHASGKRFVIGKQSDAHDFLAWLLHRLHAELGGTAARGSSIIHRVFQGEVLVRHHARRKKRRAPASAADAYEGKAAKGGNGVGGGEDGEGGGEGRDVWDVTESVSPFLFLTLEVPPMPLFRDALDRNIIPQVRTAAARFPMYCGLLVRVPWCPCRAPLAASARPAPTAAHACPPAPAGAAGAVHGKVRRAYLPGADERRPPPVPRAALAALFNRAHQALRAQHAAAAREEPHDRQLPDQEPRPLALLRGARRGRARRRRCRRAQVRPGLLRAARRQAGRRRVQGVRPLPRQRHVVRDAGPARGPDPPAAHLGERVLPAGLQPQGAGVGALLSASICAHIYRAAGKYMAAGNRASSPPLLTRSVVSPARLASSQTPL